MIMKKIVFILLLLFVGFAVFPQTSDRYRRYFKRNGDTLEVKSGKVLKVTTSLKVGNSGNLLNSLDSTTVFGTPKQLRDSLIAHNDRYYNFPNGLKVGGGDTIQTIFIRLDTLFFVTSKGNFYSLLSTYTPEVGNPHRVYVSTTGSDSNDGRDSLHPVLTLSYAQTLASAGDTICLKRGDTWNESSAVQVSISGVSGSPIVWDGNVWGTGEKATIKNSSSTGKAIMHIYDCSYLKVENIVFDGNNENLGGIVIGGNYAVYLGGQQNNEHDITLSSITVKNIGNNTAYQVGVVLQTWNNDINDITFSYDSIYSTDAHGIAIYAGRSDLGATPAWIKNTTISNCVIYDNHRYTSDVGVGIMIANGVDGLIVDHNSITCNSGETGNFLLSVDINESNSSYYPKNLTIRYNKFIQDLSSSSYDLINILNTIGNTLPVTAEFYGNLIVNNSTYTGTQQQLIEVNNNSGSFSGGSFKFYNNTMVSNANYAIQFVVDAPSIITFKNNIIYGRLSGGGYSDVLLATYASGILVHSNNLFYNADNTTILVSDNGTNYTASNISSWESTVVTADPLFVTNFTDLHLQTGSPADAAGTNILVPIYDYDGITYDNPPADGAYEKK